VEYRSLHVVDLRVDQCPASAGPVPVLADPVIFEPTIPEVVAESAAGTRGIS
jgi:hypothetical protein